MATVAVVLVRTHRKLTMMLRYKFALRGIFLVQRSEAYTSQCSPLAPKVCKKHAAPAKRVSRGLYKDSGVIWNADAVGAFNLMRLWLEKEHPDRKLSADLLGHPHVVMKVAVQPLCAAAVLVSWMHPESTLQVSAHPMPGNSLTGVVY